VNQPRYDVFLSYTRADAPAVEELAQRLKDQGIVPWLDKWNLIPGEPWQEDIEAALDACDAYAIFVGPSGMGSWQNEEMRFAINQRVTNKKPVIPVFLPGGQREQQGKLPEFLISSQWVDFRRSLDDELALHYLICGIKGKPMIPVIPVDPNLDISPYPGLKAYEPEDAQFFFGRKILTDELLERLRTKAATNDEIRFLAIIGASGSGKSSLARAGLIPALKSGALDGSEGWPVVICKPGINPVESLVLALANENIVSDTLLDNADTIARFMDEPRTLHWITNKVLSGSPDHKRICLLVDQFEELFTICRDETSRLAFIKNLRYAATVSLGRTVVVLTMRADFYGKCAAYPALAATMADSQLLVGPMTEDELLQAIETPAQMVGCEFEPGLVELLLRDAGTEAGTLPLLQHALRELWERRTGRYLRVESYNAMGKLEGALNQYANKIYSDLDDTEKEACKQLFLSLTQPGMGTEDTKRRASLKELDMVATDSLIQKLEDARLIVTEGEQGAQGKRYVEVSHEALINGWSKLREWIDTNRDMIRVKHHVTETAIQWDEEGRQADYLYQGAPLFEAEEYFINRNNKLELLQQKFLDASIELRDNREREKEAQQKKKLATMAVFTFVALGLAIVASFLYIQAESSERKAVCQLAQNYWKDGVSERDRNNNPIVASHYFMKAAEQWSACGESIRSRNARFAGNFLVKHVSLSSISSMQGGIKNALLDSASQRVIAWDGDGAVRVWDNESGEWSKLIQQDVAINYIVPGHEKKKILILGDTGRARLVDVDSKQWFDIRNNGASIAKVAFSLDDSQLLTWGDVATLRVWDTLTGNAFAPPLQNHGEVMEAGFSPDGQKVIAWSRDGRGHLWTLPDGNLVTTVALDGAPWLVVFSPDNRRVLTLAGDTLQIWDSNVLSPIQVSTPSQLMQLSGAVFSPDGERLLLWSTDGRIWYWDYATAQPVESSYRHTGSVGGAVFNQDGDHVLIRGVDDDSGWSWIWDLENETPVILEHADIVRGGSFSKDGRRLFTWSDYGAQLWNSRNGRPLVVLPRYEEKLLQATFSRDEQQILTLSDSGTARFWDIKPVVLPMDTGSRVQKAVFVEDGSQVLALGIDGTMRIWDSNTGEPLGPGWGSENAHGIQVSQNGKRILTRIGSTIQVWKNQNTQPPVNLEYEINIRDAKFAGNGERILTWDASGGAQIWDSDSGNEVARLGQIAEVYGAEFSQDNRHLLIWDLSGRIQVLDTGSWETVKKHTFDKPIKTAVFSQVGNSILICSGYAWYWEFQQGEPEKLKETGKCDGAALSNNAQQIVVWNKQSALVWNLGDGTSSTLRQSRVKGAMFIKDQVLTWGRNAARLWGVEDGRPLTPALQHDGPISGIVLSRDQQRIITWSDDALVRFWRIVQDEHSSLISHEARLGSKLDENKQLRLLSAEEWRESGGEQEGAAR